MPTSGGAWTPQVCPTATYNQYDHHKKTNTTDNPLNYQQDPTMDHQSLRSRDPIYDEASISTQSQDCLYNYAHTQLVKHYGQCLGQKGLVFTYLITLSQAFLAYMIHSSYMRYFGFGLVSLFLVKDLIIPPLNASGPHDDNGDEVPNPS